MSFRNFIRVGLLLLLVLSTVVVPEQAFAFDPYVAITITSPNPGESPIGTNSTVRFTVNLSAPSDGTLLVTLGPSTSSYTSGYTDYQCITYRALASQSYNLSFTLPSPAAPLSKEYKIWAYYRPQTPSTCPNYNSSLVGSAVTSVVFGMHWMPGEEPPSIINGPTVNTHSTTAEVRWTTDRVADTRVISVQPHDGIEVISSIVGQEHRVWLSGTYPGETYTIQFQSCNTKGCVSRTQVLTTKPGCLQISFTYNGRLQNPDWFNNKWDGTGRLDIGGVAPQQYQIHLRALVDTAAASSVTSRWEPHTNTHIGNLFYQLTLPNFTHGGLRRFDDPVWQYQLTKSGTITNNGHTGVSYTLPVFTTAQARRLNLDFKITGGRGQYNGHEMGICPSGTATEKYGSLNFLYRPMPLDSGNFQPTLADLRLWENIKDEEAKRKWGDDALVNAFGLIPSMPYWAGVALTVAQTYFGYRDLQPAQVYDIGNFVPADKEQLNWTIYSMAGVGVNGKAGGQRSYYILYGRRIITSPEGQPITTEPRVWQGIIYGYPRWLIGSSAQATFDDCSTWGGTELSPGACMSAESFSPVEVQTRDAAGQILSKNTNTIGGTYTVLPESDGSLAEELRFPLGDYHHTIQGVNTGSFSLFFVRPYEAGWQGILYNNIPIAQSQTLSLDIPQNGNVPPLLLPSGQRVWPADYVAPETRIVPNPTTPNGKNGWYTQDIGIAIEAKDAMTGVASTTCQLNETGWFTYTHQFVVTEERSDNHVTCFSTDNAGTVESVKVADFKLDKTPPTTTSSATGILGKNDWFTSTVTVDFQARDKVSGVEFTEYRVDNSQWIRFHQAFAIDTEGIHTVEFRSIDVAGNTETIQSRTIKIDKTPPVLTAWVDQSTYLRLDMLVLHYDASDAVSGVYTVKADLLGDSLTKDTPYELLWPPLGDLSIQVQAEDYAGWTTTRYVTFTLTTNLERLRATVLRLRALNEIDRDGIVHGLTTKVDGAITAVNRGKPQVAKNHLNALIHELEGIRGHRITERGTDLLVTDTQYVLGHLQ